MRRSTLQQINTYLKKRPTFLSFPPRTSSKLSASPTTLRAWHTTRRHRISSFTPSRSARRCSACTSTFTRGRTRVALGLHALSYGAAFNAILRRPCAAVHPWLRDRSTLSGIEDSHTVTTASTARGRHFEWPTAAGLQQSKSYGARDRLFWRAGDAPAVRRGTHEKVMNDDPRKTKYRLLLHVE